MGRSVLAVAALLLVSGCSAEPTPSEPVSAPPVTSAAAEPSAPAKAASEIPPTEYVLSAYDECILESANLAAEFYGVDPGTMLDHEEVLAACDENGPVEQPAVQEEAPADLDALYNECIESNATMAADMNGGTIEEWRDDPDVVAICEGQVAFEEATQ